MSRGTDPSQHRRRLRVELRRAREDAGLSQRDAAEALEWSLSKLIRIEGGTVSLSVTDLRALLRLYGVPQDAPKTQALVEAARGSKGQPWWAEYRQLVSPQFEQYLSYETAATSFHVYHPSLVPGLLQTADFAASLLAPAFPRDLADHLVRLRLRRQENVYDGEGHGEGHGDGDNGAAGGRGGPQLRFVLDEAALHRHIGGPAVMLGQLARLRELAEHDHVSLRVIPFSEGAYAALGGAFVVLGFPDDDDVLFLETAEGSFVNRHDHELIVRYRHDFEQASDLALTEGESLKLIGEMAARYERHLGRLGG